MIHRDVIICFGDYSIASSLTWMRSLSLLEGEANVLSYWQRGCSQQLEATKLILLCQLSHCSFLMPAYFRPLSTAPRSPSAHRLTGAITQEVRTLSLDPALRQAVMRWSHQPVDVEVRPAERIALSQLPTASTPGVRHVEVFEAEVAHPPCVAASLGGCD